MAERQGSIASPTPVLTTNVGYLPFHLGREDTRRGGREYASHAHGPGCGHRLWHRDASPSLNERNHQEEDGTISSVTRVKKDKLIQTGKVLVTCTLTITGVGSHSGSGEEWADDENAMTSAEAQAFKRACTCFGLGRYFYSFSEMWVELNDYKQPLHLPNLPPWALPKSDTSPNGSITTGGSQRQTRPSAAANKGPLDADVTTTIERHRQELGHLLYQSILSAVAHVRSARDIPTQQTQQNVLQWMESGARGMARIREIAAEIPEETFYSILDRHGLQSLAKVQTFGALKKLVDEMAQVRPRATAA